MCTSVRKIILSVLVCLLLLAVTGGAYAEGGQAQENWEVCWAETTGAQRDEYVLGQHETGFVPDGQVIVRLAPPAGRYYVVGNAAALSVYLGKNKSNSEYRVSITLPVADGVEVELVPLAPVVKTWGLNVDSTLLVQRSGFRLDFSAPPAEGGSLVFVLPPKKLLLSLEAHYAVVFRRPGQHVLAVSVTKNGKPVKQDNIIVQVGEGAGSWRANVEWGRMGVSLLASGAKDAHEAKAHLSFVRNACVTVKTTGDLVCDPAGTIPLPLDASPVWIRLTPTTEMPVGTVELVYTVECREPKLCGVAMAGELKPQVSVVNAPPVADQSTGKTQLPGRLYWPFGAVVVLGCLIWALRRHVVDVWLEREGDSVWVVRGRRGPGAVRAVIRVVYRHEDCREFAVHLTRCGRQPAVSGSGEDWKVVEVATPGWRNLGVATVIVR